MKSVYCAAALVLMTTSAMAAGPVFSFEKGPWMDTIRDIWLVGTCPSGQCADGRWKVTGRCGVVKNHSFKIFYVFPEQELDFPFIKGSFLHADKVDSSNYNGYIPSNWYGIKMPFYGRPAPYQNGNEPACDLIITDTKNNTTDILKQIVSNSATEAVCQNSCYNTWLSFWTLNCSNGIGSTICDAARSQLNSCFSSC